MTPTPRMTLSGVVLGSPDARRLADFYHRLLGWPVEQDEPGWVKIVPSGGGTGLSFQTEEHYTRPVWPAGPDDPQMMIHLDFQVDDLESASAHALAVGATLAEYQPEDDVLVHLDPAGHPFCLFLPGA